MGADRPEPRGPRTSWRFQTVPQGRSHVPGRPHAPAHGLVLGGRRLRGAHRRRSARYSGRPDAGGHGGRGAHGGRAYDFRPMLGAIEPIISAADLAVCHIETPLSPTGRHLSGYSRFNGPPQIAAALHATGYDACSTASNHSLDQGAKGVSGTLHVLDGAGLRHAGIARNPQEARATML